ncbi:hypothetical protein LUW74_43770 [Actinomadura madurae]|uniref:hypothetical protein n=1 Tax=Actinomadura madurae TaxID=1993 RepID=UPI0020262BAA|nr:hypothetical protein [Actinomadura madurae]URN09594.1 hypothetical protein LUW74_43770 [Actinomadura madurae]
MHQLAGYVLAIRGVGVSMAPEHIKTIDLVPGEGEDVVAATLEGLRDSGLTAADFRSMVVFIAPEGPSAIVQYAALCGFAGRRIDAYADGTLLRFGRMERDAPVLPDAGRPEEHLMWAQVGVTPWTDFRPYGSGPIRWTRR